MAKKSEYTIPPREWYTLEQAIKRIYKLTGEELDISDLHHYWLIGKLNLRMPFSYSNGECYIGRIPLTAEEITIEQDGRIVADSFYYENDYCKINKQGEISEKLEVIGYFSVDWIFEHALKREKEYQHWRGYYQRIRIEKCLRLHTLKELREGDKIIYEDDVTLNVYLSYPKNNYPKCDLDDLVITEQDLILFLKSEEKNIVYRRKELPNKFKKETSNNEIKPNARREQGMFNFIKILLDINYGIRDGKEARNAMNNGLLGKQIEGYKIERGVECIKGQSLGIWYDNF